MVSREIRKYQEKIRKEQEARKRKKSSIIFIDSFPCIRLNAVAVVNKNKGLKIYLEKEKKELNAKK